MQFSAKCCKIIGWHTPLRSWRPLLENVGSANRIIKFTKNSKPSQVISYHLAHHVYFKTTKVVSFVKFILHFCHPTPTPPHPRIVLLLLSCLIPFCSFSHFPTVLLLAIACTSLLVLVIGSYTIRTISHYLFLNFTHSK